MTRSSRLGERVEPHALTLKTVVVNPTLDDARFTKAQMTVAAAAAAGHPEYRRNLQGGDYSITVGK
jgi:hypothetical protein